MTKNVKTTIIIGSNWVILLLLLLSLNSEEAISQNIIDLIESNHKKYIPEGIGPFPIVIAIPGCSGVSLNGEATDEGRIGDEGDRLFRRHYPKMALRLKKQGYLVYLIDYLTAEGELNTCNGEIPSTKVGEYISEAIRYVKLDPEGDKTKINIIGWSHGGAGVLNWLTKLDEGVEGVEGIKSVIAVYPDCKSSTPWGTTVPVLMLLGENDDIAIPQDCHLLKETQKVSAQLQIKSYQEARHGFDITEGPSKLVVGEGLTIGKNEAASTEAWHEIVEFLKRN